MTFNRNGFAVGLAGGATFKSCTTIAAEPSDGACSITQAGRIADRLSGVGPACDRAPAYARAAARGFSLIEVMVA